LSVLGVASPGAAGYDFLGKQLRIGWRGGRMDWVRILAFVTAMVDQELLARIEYLAVENRILKAQLKGRLKLSDAERATLGEIGHRLGRKVLGEVLQNIPVFREHAVGHSDDIGGDPTSGPSSSRKPAMDNQVIVFSNDQARLVLQRRWRTPNQIEQAVAPQARVLC
jgi:hypothetical protein